MVLRGCMILLESSADSWLDLKFGHCWIDDYKITAGFNIFNIEDLQVLTFSIVRICSSFGSSRTSHNPSLNCSLAKYFPTKNELNNSRYLTLGRKK